MPKGYGYDEAPKKASGFKMKGYSYPGQSPMKGAKKRAEIAAANQAISDAMLDIEDFGNKAVKSSDLTKNPTVYEGGY